MKKLFILIFYISAIAFCAMVVFSHFDIYRSFASNDFSSVEGIKAFAIKIVSVLADVSVVLITLLSFLRFIFTFSKGKTNEKKIIKTMDTVGAYFTYLMVLEVVGIAVALIGKSEFMDTMKGLVTVQEFYMPFFISIVAGIVLLIARLTARANIFSGVLVTIGVALLIASNFMYFRGTMTSHITTARFYLSVATCALAIVPVFIPDK